MNSSNDSTNSNHLSKYLNSLHEFVRRNVDVDGNPEVDARNASGSQLPDDYFRYGNSLKSKLDTSKRMTIDCCSMKFSSEDPDSIIKDSVNVLASQWSLVS
jgi:hypothetical protein